MSESNPTGRTLEDRLLAEIEARAVELARGGGRVLSGYFGGSLNIEYKDDNQRDPVTEADHKTQDFLTKGIQESFPEHDILGEEDDENAQDPDAAAGDFLWVLDPLDGTKNFLHGLPVYACSVGVLYRGEPVVGAVYTPWPEEGGGVVHHARRGGGAFTNGTPISAVRLDGPQANQLITVPGMFDRLYRFDAPMQGKTGDPRVTGSIAYELIMVARGVTQYMYTSNPHLWGHSWRRRGGDGSGRGAHGRPASRRPAWGCSPRWSGESPPRSWTTGGRTRLKSATSGAGRGPSSSVARPSLASRHRICDGSATPVSGCECGAAAGAAQGQAVRTRRSARLRPARTLAPAARQQSVTRSRDCGPERHKARHTR